MKPIRLNQRCTSCPDGEMMVLDQFVYCSHCDPAPGAHDPDPVDPLS